jgi:integrase
MSLTVKRVTKLIRKGEPGRFLDSGSTGVRGLHLCVGGKNNASWGLRYQLDGRTHWLGLGSARDITLEKARQKAKAAREQLADKIDPLDLKKAERQQRKDEKAKKAIDAARMMSFEKCAEAFILARQTEWKSARHGAEWKRTLASFVYPIIGTMDVAAIERPEVLRVLEQQVPANGSLPAGKLWNVRTISADRTRSRIELVLDYAVARGHRQPGVNPAAWSQLQHAGLAKPSKAAPPVHHAAVPYAEVPAVIAELRRHEGVAAQALLFTILTAARSGEVLGAVWDEIDLANKVWTIPEARMKSDREHKVPLSPQVVELLQTCYREQGNNYVFIGLNQPRLSHSAMGKILRRINRAETVHGFRSSFADFAHERTAHTNLTIETCLAHTVGDATERAYRRTDVFNKRRQLMDKWGEFCTTSPRRAAGNNVTSIRAASEAS